MSSGFERRRTIRIRRSQLLHCKLDHLDKPAIKIAEEFEEYCKAFRLVYDEYHHVGYTDEHPGRLYYNEWSLLPTTSVFVFKSFLNVISTVSLIKDSKMFGLPADAVFRDMIDGLRAQGRAVAEVGALATTRQRRWSNALILLFKAMLYYCRETKIKKINDIVVMVNPKHMRFYTQVLLFEPFGETQQYDKVGAPAVPLRLNLDQYDDKLAEMYADSDFETDLHAFFTKFSDPILTEVGDVARSMRKTEVGDVVPGMRKTLDPYAVFFFLKNRPEVAERLSSAQRKHIHAIYHQSIFSGGPQATDDAGGDDVRSSVKPVLERLHLENKEDYTDTAFSRNLGLLDYAEQQKLLQTRVAIPGLGGVGGVHLTTLARTGIGAFTLADFDTYSPVNINRQYGSDLGSFTRPKLYIMRDRALGINPFLDIRCFPHGVTVENMDAFLDGVDILVDSLDFFAQDIRRTLFNRALKRNIPVITAAPAGCSCSLLVFMPGTEQKPRMNYDQYFGVTDKTDDIEQVIRFSLGVAPRPTHMRYLDRRFVNIYDRRVPSLDIGCQLSAGMAAMEVVRIVTRGKPSVAVPGSVQFDARVGVFRKSRLLWGVNTPWQRAKIALARKFFMYPAQASKAALTKPDTVPRHAPVIPEDALRFLLRAGIQAPSGDNVQPWKFSFDEKSVTLLINREADSSFFNVNQAASLLATGAALQSMEYAAGSLGLESRVELFPDGEGSSRVAVMRLTPTGTPFDELMEGALWRRTTNRRMYSRAPVPSAVWERLGRLADRDNGGLLLHQTDRASLKTLAKAVYLSDRVRVERRDLHEYLMSVLRFEPVPEGMDEAQRPTSLKTGMPLKNLQAGPAGEFYLRLVRPWRVMEWAIKLGLGRVMPAYGGLSVLLSGGVGLICSKSYDEPALVRAGKAMQRVWCALEHYGFALQPMAALPLLTLRLQHMEGEGGFSAEHVRLLRQAWDLAAEALAVPSGHVPVFMFRTGKAGLISQRTYRYDVDDLLAPRL